MLKIAAGLFSGCLCTGVTFYYLVQQRGAIFFLPVGSRLNSVWRRISYLHPPPPPPIINNMRNRGLFQEAGRSDEAKAKVSALINERLSACWCFLRYQASLGQEEQSKHFNKSEQYTSSAHGCLFILPFNRLYGKYFSLWDEFKNFLVVEKLKQIQTCVVKNRLSDECVSRMLP